MRRIRHGYSLVETLVVIALTTITLTITAVTVHSLYRAERRVHGDLDDQRTLNQLAQQLRYDAHEARGAVMEKGTKPSSQHNLKLTLAADRSIGYAVLSNRIERIVYRHANIEHREVFRLAFPDSHWTIDDDRDRPLLTLHLVNRNSEQASTAHDHKYLSIQTAVGIAAASAGS